MPDMAKFCAAGVQLCAGDRYKTFALEGTRVRNRVALHFHEVVGEAQEVVAGIAIDIANRFRAEATIALG